MRHNTIRLILSIFVFLIMSIPAIYTFFARGFVFAVAVFFLSSIALALAVIMFISIYNTVDDFLWEIEEKKKHKSIYENIIESTKENTINEFEKKKDNK